MSHNIFYKTKRVQAEFDCGTIDPRLRVILIDLAEWVYFEFGKPMTLTCIRRNQAENEAVEGMERSAHISDDDGYVRAADIRSRNFLKPEKKRIVHYILDKWNRRQKYVHCIYHDADSGPHFHININYGK